MAGDGKTTINEILFDALDEAGKTDGHRTVVSDLDRPPGVACEGVVQLLVRLPVRQDPGLLELAAVDKCVNPAADKPLDRIS